MHEINDFAKATYEKPLDPGMFCVMSVGFLRAESQERSPGPRLSITDDAEPF
jgi:hypothetical protein